MTHGGFKVGDFVVADQSMYDNYDGTTFRVVEVGYNLIGLPLVFVIDVETISAITPHRACFYPQELSLAEQGERQNDSQPAGG